MRYKAKRTDIVDPARESLEWEKANIGYVSNVERWRDYTQTPITSFKLLYGPCGISVLMRSEEKNLRAECNEENGDVYCDSCMEFFFKPDVHDTRYLNFEINPKGVLHLGLGDGRANRRLLYVDRSIFNISVGVYKDMWELKLYIPFGFLSEYFDVLSPICKANFYKCGDMTDHVHYGAWSEPETPTPDFHIPDFFGKIEFGCD